MEEEEDEEDEEEEKKKKKVSRGCQGPRCPCNMGCVRMCLRYFYGLQET